ncbi:MAG TPA: hypothetical protein VF139_17255 [Candidatus Polarisedimenticolaceae bacterium]
MGGNPTVFALGAAAILAVATLAPCEAAVLRTIAVDGDLSDWSEVRSDPYQRSLDGPAGALVDRDAPVPTTGRDLTEFAWTWDATHLFLYTARAGSDNNQQRFWYYIDIDEDGRQEAAEPVVLVQWFGSSRRTDVSLYRYLPASAGGDPLGSPAGFADGWDMPGGVQLVRFVESGYGGESTGRRMESRVAWSELGVPPGTPLRFHVATSASTNLPSQIHDNMGGPGGLVGWTRVAGVTLEPDRTGTVSVGGRVAYAHTLTNTSLASDTFTLTWAGTGTLVPTSVAWHRDTDADGVLDAGEPAVVSSGPVAAGASIALLLVVDTPAAATDGQAATFTGRSTSAASPTTFDVVVDTVTVATPLVTLVKSVDRAVAAPGETVAYTLTYTGGGSAAAYSVTVTDPVPAGTAYVPGSATGPGASVTFSRDGGASYGASDAPPVTHVRFTLAAPLAPGATGSVSFRVTVQ